MRRLTRHDRAELRSFGLGLAAMLVLLFWLILPWLGGRPRPLWPPAVAAVLAALALAWPVAVLPLHRVLAPPLHLLASLNNAVLLGIVYFGIVTPLGAVQRWRRRLHYRVGFDAGAASYRIAADPQHRTRLEEPF